ncbi:hypothetical protein U1Q18_008634, partial [Sarracenia purpurea var. burkii]
MGKGSETRTPHRQPPPIYRTSTPSIPSTSSIERRFFGRHRELRASSIIAISLTSYGLDVAAQDSLSPLE